MNYSLYIGRTILHIYIIRHADPIYDSDQPLTENGLKEARALSERLISLGIDELYSSNSRRAIKTASFFAEESNLKLNVQEWLREPSSKRITQNGFEYCLWDVFGEFVRSGELNLASFEWFKSEPFKSLGAESLWKTFCEECDKFIETLGYRREGNRYKIVKGNKKRIALVCHNGTLQLFLAHLLAIPAPLSWCSFFSWPSGVTDLYFEIHSENWAAPRALSVSDTSHLYKHGLTPQPRGMGDYCAQYSD